MKILVYRHHFFVSNSFSFSVKQATGCTARRTAAFILSFLPSYHRYPRHAPSLPLPPPSPLVVFPNNSNIILSFGLSRRHLSVRGNCRKGKQYVSDCRVAGGSRSLHQVSRAPIHHVFTMLHATSTAHTDRSSVFTL